jgi:hypothetical protein
MDKRCQSCGARLVLAIESKGFCGICQDRQLGEAMDAAAMEFRRAERSWRDAVRALEGAMVKAEGALVKVRKFREELGQQIAAAQLAGQPVKEASAA